MPPGSLNSNVTTKRLENDVVDAYVASQSASNEWRTTVLQFDLVAAGLARIDESTA